MSEMICVLSKRFARAHLLNLGSYHACRANSENLEAVKIL